MTIYKHTKQTLCFYKKHVMTLKRMNNYGQRNGVAPVYGAGEQTEVEGSQFCLDLD